MDSHALRRTPHAGLLSVSDPAPHVQLTAATAIVEISSAMGPFSCLMLDHSHEGP